MKNYPHDLQILFMATPNRTENSQQNTLLSQPTPPPSPKIKLKTGLPKQLQYLRCVGCSECWVGFNFLFFCMEAKLAIQGKH